ncbi:MAG: aminodeoxychorismate synthase component I [Kiritimatiellia bacterium]
MTSAPAFPAENLVVLRDEASGRWLRFQHPVEILSAVRVEDVLPRLREIEQAVEDRHLHAAGWIAYEAAPAFDPALAVRAPGPLPLLWFGLFEKPESIDLPAAAEPLPAGWNPDLSPEAYARAFDQIKRHIREGDTYQVNYSYRLHRGAFEQDPWQAFLALVGAPRAPFGAYVSAGPWRICSASPELFFRLDGSRLESRPMKGTAPRGLSAAQDRAQIDALLACEKNRAENLMIVDMVRNDLGRVARPGTVRTVRLCDPEKFPTVWQLVSAVAAETDAAVSEIFSALFPPASITGAPKNRTMRIIADLESSPRQVYTGAIGFLAPGRRAQFNVAIRTLLLDVRSRRAEYGVGGGIVWDSDRAAEQAECRAKARILSTPPRPPFALLETMLWTPEDGIRLLELHLARLRDSADYFGYPFDAARIRAEVETLARSLPRAPQRVRLLLAEDGTPTLQASPLAPLASGPFFHIALARRPVDRADVFLYHKTTNRRIYEEAKADFPGHDDVILYNEDGEATESTLANLAVEIDGVLCTPPVECGLLPGVARAELLARGILRERRIPLPLLRESPRIFLLNSVRGLFPAVLDLSDSKTG